MTNVCLIGVSGYAEVHYRLLTAGHAAGDLKIVGATVINQAEEMEKCAQLRGIGCPIFDDYEVMLKELAGKADLCCIPTGIPLHRPMTVAALEAGMHVLVEKPAAGGMGDVQAMQAAAETADRTVAVGYQHMYTSVVMAVKRHILGGTIGRLESIKCLVLWPRGDDYYRRNRWAGRLMLEGRVVNDSPFNNAVAHELMMMLFQAGPAEREAATPTGVRAELYRANPIESFDTAGMEVATAEGVPIRFYATHACRELVNPEIQIRGHQGSITLSHTGAVIRADGAEPIVLATGGYDGARRAMLTAVLDVVHGGSSFICDLDLAARQTAVVEMLHANCEILPVPGQRGQLSDGSPSTYIPGIEQALRRAAAGEVLLRESGWQPKTAS